MKTVIIIFACLLFTGLNAQERKVSEEEISFDILKWHYSSYPKCTGSQWAILEVEGQNFYRVSFNFQGQDYQAEYDQNGMVVREIINMDDKIPVSIAHRLETYEKYKVNSFIKVSDMRAQKIIYKLDIKVKSEGQKVLWYDENLIEVPNTDFSSSISGLNY